MINQITRILNDPSSMKQIMDIASNLNGEMQEANDDTPTLLAEGLTKSVELLKAKEEKQQALIRALLPFLKPGHQQRLERAVQIAKLSSIAKTALSTKMQQNTDAIKEEQNDV